jgi:hypothetical protein
VYRIKSDNKRKLYFAKHLFLPSNLITVRPFKITI